MATLTTPPKRPPVRLPDIPLSRLPERTKDFIIASSCTGKPVSDVICEALSQAAAKAGFTSSEKDA